MQTLMILFLIASLGLTFFLYRKLINLEASLKDQLEEHADNLSEQVSYQLTSSTNDQRLAISQDLNRLQTDIYQQLTDIRDVLHQNLTDSRDRSDQRLETINQQLTLAVKDMQASNEKRLEQMRLTVEEKLEKTLQTRLQASFDSVSKQLESVNQGLGEMKTVAQDVGTLNKVLSNTKTRGILGELQLGQIIEDILTESQYEREYATVPGSSERVEYAIKMPGASQGDYVYLPIDSKFPLEDYYRLEDAYESGDREEVERYRKALLASIKRFAKDINQKYIKPPETTNFGVLFLPTEGLYAEVVRQSAFFDSLRRDENIVVAGPSTMSALLNSLSVGFRTLNIQKNADDISKVLGNVKLEFDKFGNMLVKAQKQLSTASKTVDSLLTTRTNSIRRALETIETYQDSATTNLLGISPLEDEDSYEN
ncbi:DNA recombination protein RmuC [Streptococcus pluranimalium]|uniref:DNA recombination protein RmuC n=1 Tax=Streptococcus pluranimalium TaxID=82348 RepID=UPI001C4BBD74|nr:DNA recombination protein RmuC [Streptococcus pluranimalium]MDY3041236.1 DNA recombination protein RmuC [Streptococcus pluranimalium]WFM79641.1 DNA recombination protein RmuC [Streptococcus pluranimalium]